VWTSLEVNQRVGAHHRGSPMAAHGRGRGAVGGGDGEVGKHCGTRARQLEELMGRGSAGGGGRWHGYSLRT
jgi:hypothetical protein